MNNYQREVSDWVIECMGQEVLMNKQERAYRFVEEAMELAQACGVSESEVLQLAYYVFDRPTGEVALEVGGVMNTLAAMCTAYHIDLYRAGWAELERISEPSMMARIRAKHAAKKLRTPLPGEAG